MKLGNDGNGMAEMDKQVAGGRPSNDELVDDLMMRAGGLGPFSFVVYFGVSAGVNNVRAFVNHMIPYLIQKQIYSCTLSRMDVGDEHDEICTRENICAGDARILSWQVDYTNNRSLHNYV